MQKSPVICAFVLGLAALNAAHAGTGEWIVAAGLGSASYADGEYDDDDVLAIVSAGYRITERLSIEGAYLDLGRVSDSNLPQGAVSLSQDTLAVDASGLAVSAVWEALVSDRWFVAGRIGVTVLDVDKQWTGGTVVDPVLAADTGGSDSNLFFGIGAGVHLNDRLSLSAAWDRFDVADIDVDGIYLKLGLAF